MVSEELPEWCPNVSGIAREFLNPTINDHWYRVLFSQLTDGRIEPDDFKISQNNVSFITFNYDRSLENYLYDAIQRNFESAGPSEGSKEINSIPIIHVYGKLASLEWQNTDSEAFWFAYKKGPASLNLNAFEMRKNIYVMHGKRDNPNVEKSKQLLEQADRVYFLGFGYSKENMEILDIPNTITKARRIFGTAINFPTPLVQNLTQKFKTHVNTIVTIGNNMKCRELLYTYPLEHD